MMRSELYPGTLFWSSFWSVSILFILLMSNWGACHADQFLGLTIANKYSSDRQLPYQ